MNVNVGFIDKRNSSRVLKPPGGETSDIFGVREQQAKDEEKISSKINEISENIKTVTIENSRKITELFTNVIETNGESNNAEPNGNTEANGDAKQSETNETEEVLSVVYIEGEQTETKSETKEAIDDKPTNNIIQEPITPEPVKPVSKRIPPGGYSSGLW